MKPVAYRKVIPAALVALVASALAFAEEKGFPGIETLMTEEEFRAAGIHRLSAEEREALDAWLLRYTAGDAQLLQKTEVVREAEDEEEFEVVSRIKGDFSGWSGETVFELENGQTWVQRLDGRYRYKGPPNPEVRIDRNWLGFYRLTIVETGRRVGVSPR
ncbi:MAG: hypothetical protein V2I82_09885 [Halieaceae bacterium]|jgi:hypothetical protein|nr:hypothetical protein [Halieaceae bacterium]